MNRIISILIGVVLPVLPLIVSSGEIALTFDDAPTPDSALMSGAERTRKLISAHPETYNALKKERFFSKEH